jgi:hypothetical protein
VCLLGQRRLLALRDGLQVAVATPASRRQQGHLPAWSLLRTCATGIVFEDIGMSEGGSEASRWLTGKKLTALLGTAGAVVGLATGVLTLRDQLFSKEEVESTPAEQKLSAATASQLSDGVQLSRFKELLGQPLSEKRLPIGGEYVQTTWVSTDLAVDAYSDIQEQVVAYKLTALSPEFDPLVEQVRGGVRLRSSSFADIQDEPEGVAGLYPPNGQWSYMELHGGGFATDYKQAVLAASSAANAKDSAATELLDLDDCMPFSVFEQRPGCNPSRVAKLRGGLHITSVTIGEPHVLEALEGAGALFFAETSG